VRYGPVIQDHFHHPRNVGPLPDATHRGAGGVPGEGPYVVLWLKVEDGVIRRAAYRTVGCPAAIGCASVLAELVTGRPVDQALRLDEPALMEALGPLPEGKEHCPPLALAALKNALSGREGARDGA